MTTIPRDPVMLLSYINTQLRDHYSSLEQLCEDLELDRMETEKKLLAIDYRYDGKLNQFR